MNAQPLDLASLEGHTPEGWTLDGRDVVVRGRGTIAIVPMPTVGGVFEAVYNARLIAAAPALLAELKAYRARDAKVAELVEAATGFRKYFSSDDFHSNDLRYAWELLGDALQAYGREHDADRHNSPAFNLAAKIAKQAETQPCAN